MSTLAHLSPLPPCRDAWLALLLCAAPTLACPGTPATTTAGDPTTDTVTSADAGTTGVPTTTAGPGSSTSLDPTSSTSSTSAPTSTSEPTSTSGNPCPAGELGCSCLQGQVCGDRLVCIADVCAEPDPGVCGDGVLDRDEACDAGADNGPGKACKADCTLNVCGDGDPGPGEQCDDGDQDDGDGCSATCQLEICGDGVVGPGEQCDDGDQDDGDGCDADCTWTPCNLLWQKSYPLPNVSGYGRRIGSDADRNLIIVGDRNVSQIDSRALVLKLDPDGALLWT